MKPTRRRIAGVAASMAAIPFLLPSAASADAMLGASNNPEDMPTMSACSGRLIEVDHEISANYSRIVIPYEIPAGRVDISQILTMDSREPGSGEGGEAVAPDPERAAPEKYEKVRVEYWAGDRMLAATPNYSTDLTDGPEEFAWATSPLGGVDIFETADRIEIVHSSEFMKTDDLLNDLTVVALCKTWEPLHTEPNVAATIDCNNATLHISNDGNAKLHVNVKWNGNSNDYEIAPYGGSYDKVVPLAEDAWADIVVTDTDTGEVLWSKKWYTDCVMAPTTTVKQVEAPATTVAPTTTVAAEVLGVQVVASAPQAQLARTGSQTSTNAGIGAALLTLGAGLITFGRRRKTSEI